ncbi:MAG TPA: tetratricopeptide repeat protein [Fervidobacterium sp.]|nr:tetratricopeptide repeat protein [Fervidobacterium sp.]MBP8656915.1 tetratricopeptide repeat protein [Fervidobacterium sp.]HPT59528.1 tetratricopeptide repeat protein [Fervidobacterium sp.]
MSRKFLAFFLVLITVIGFSTAQTGMEYYSAAELSYKSGDYKTALDNYEMALAADNTLEGYDPQIKFKMGISAYMIGNYDKARNYLAGYDNDFVRNLLESISSRETEDEWKRWIKQNNPTTSEVVSQDEVSTSTAVTVTQPSSGSSNVAIIIVIFSTTFVVLMIAEYRIYRVKRKVIELPLESRQRASAQKIESEIASTNTPNTAEVSGEASQSSDAAEKSSIDKTPSELDLIPNGAKIIDFEELINSEIDVFKDIFEQLDTIDNKKEEMPSVESAKNTDNSDVLQNMEFDAEPPIEEIDREALINEVLDESKNLIDEIEKISNESGETKQSEVTPVELEGIEAELIGKVKKIVDTISENKDKETESESEEQPVEDYEKLQKPFEEFDELEKISEEDANILMKKLLILSRGERD